MGGRPHIAPGGKSEGGKSLREVGSACVQAWGEILLQGTRPAFAWLIALKGQGKREYEECNWLG